MCEISYMLHSYNLARVTWVTHSKTPPCTHYSFHFPCYPPRTVLLGVVLVCLTNTPPRTTWASRAASAAEGPLSLFASANTAATASRGLSDVLLSRSSATSSRPDAKPRVFAVALSLVLRFRTCEWVAPEMVVVSPLVVVVLHPAAMDVAAGLPLVSAVDLVLSSVVVPWEVEMVAMMHSIMESHMAVWGMLVVVAASDYVRAAM